MHACCRQMPSCMCIWHVARRMHLLACASHMNIMSMSMSMGPCTRRSMVVFCLRVVLCVWDTDLPAVTEGAPEIAERRDAFRRAWQAVLSGLSASMAASCVGLPVPKPESVAVITDVRYHPSEQASCLVMLLKSLAVSCTRDAPGRSGSLPRWSLRSARLLCVCIRTYSVT